jgi:hypothetical protein
MDNKQTVWECYRLLGIIKTDEWRGLLEKCLQQVDCPYNYDIKGTSIRVWNSTNPGIKVPSSVYICRNGYEIQRVDFGKSKEGTSIGIGFTRLVFDPNSKLPVVFSSDELFSKDKYPEVLRHQPMIAGIKPLIEFFNKSLIGKQLEPYIDYKVIKQDSNIIYHFGKKSETLTKVIENQGLSKNLLGLVRMNTAFRTSTIRLGVLSVGVKEPKNALDIGREVVKVLNSWQCETSIEDLRNGDNIYSFICNSSQGQPIVLIALDGKKGDRPAADMIEWMKYLNSEQIAFQLCSNSSNPIYARHGLAIAVLAKASGSIFTTEPIGFPNFDRSWFVGLDLGKGGSKKGKVVVITLTNPDGNLLAHWRATKNDDETLSPELLNEGLAWITCQAENLGGNRHFYVIRDGLRPHHESLEFYRKALFDRDFTLIEYSKSGSPLIHEASFEPTPGTTVIPEGSEFTALYPCVSPQRGVLTTPVKFRAQINPNAHSSSDLALLLTALCHSATLSFQPSRLPAPLQWANGLARLSYTDLQFAGWSHRVSKFHRFIDK